MTLGKFKKIFSEAAAPGLLFAHTYIHTYIHIAPPINRAPFQAQRGFPRFHKLQKCNLPRHCERSEAIQKNNFDRLRYRRELLRNAKSMECHDEGIRKINVTPSGFRRC